MIQFELYISLVFQLDAEKEEIQVSWSLSVSFHSNFPLRGFFQVPQFVKADYTMCELATFIIFAHYYSKIPRLFGTFPLDGATEKAN